MSKQSYSDKPEATIPPIQRGRYQHYKGQFYEVIDVAHHSETQEPLVLYRALYGARGLWVRPYSMFFENIKTEGSLVPRFAFLGEEA
jgi:hypothetical protein